MVVLDNWKKIRCENRDCYGCRKEENKRRPEEWRKK
jgi:hypothetical protein